MKSALPPIHSLNETTLREVVFRTVMLQDVKFITSSWVNSYKSAPSVSYMRDHSYYTHQHLLIEYLIPASRVIVAVDKSDPHRIYGWLVYEYNAPTLTLHYTYVKIECRRNGLATALITEAFRQASQHETKPSRIVWTHQTNKGRHFMGTIGPRLLDPLPYEYNPYALLFAPESKAQ